MASNYKYILTSLARQDVIDIWQYSAQEWGVEQADEYAYNLHATLQGLTEHPKKGAEIVHIAEGVRRIIYQRHCIFYRISGFDIEVFAILHANMDIFSMLQGRLH